VPRRLLVGDTAEMCEKLLVVIFDRHEDVDRRTPIRVDDRDTRDPGRADAGRRGPFGAGAARGGQLGPVRAAPRARDGRARSLLGQRHG
jgi:hypothetical protein